MMKHLLFIMVLGLFGFTSMAQELSKNNIYASNGWVTGDVYAGGDFSGNGFILGYSRYITDRIYWDITYGKTDFEGRNNIFFLGPEEMGRFNMTEFSLGGGYDLFQSKDFILSGKLSYLRIAHASLQSQIGSGDDIVLRVTGRIHGPMACFSLVIRNFELL
jgi:hypothetical protein